MKRIWQVLSFSLGALLLLIYTAYWFGPQLFLIIGVLLLFISVLGYIGGKEGKTKRMPAAKLLIILTFLGTAALQLYIVFSVAAYLLHDNFSVVWSDVLSITALAFIPLDIYLFRLILKGKNYKAFTVLSIIFIILPIGATLTARSVWREASNFVHYNYTLLVDSQIKIKPPFDTANLPEKMSPRYGYGTANGRTIIVPRTGMDVEEMDRQGIEYYGYSKAPKFYWASGEEGTIRASLAGKVAKIDEYSSGKTVWIETYFWVMAYEGVTSLDEKITVGGKVKQGQKIGKANELTWRFGQYYPSNSTISWGDRLNDTAYCVLDYASSSLTEALGKIQIPDEYLNAHYDRLCQKGQNK